MRLRDDREGSIYGGHGIDRHLPTMENKPWVFWTKSGNSYVVTWRHGWHLVSINGIGEIRWEYDVPLPRWADDGAREALAYFLVDDEWTR